ncbi:MATE family efflux transporter [Sulfurospirillum sp. 1307]
MSDDLTTGDIKKHLRDIAIPSSVGYLFHTMFNVTDTYFAGVISTQAVASLSLTFSIFFIIIAIAGGMSQATTALLGNAIGEKNNKSTKSIIYHAGLLAVFLTFFLTIFGLSISPFLLKLLGAKDDYLGEALSYVNVILYGSVFFVGVFFANAMLNSIGNTKAFRNFLIGGFFLNIILDYLFVAKFNFGIAGIAYATIIVEACGMFYLMFELKKSHLIDNMPEFEFDKEIFLSFFKQGIPPTLNMSLMALGMFIITYYIAPFGKHAVAAYGIAIRIEQIILLPSLGINVAVLSLISQNNGAKLFKRVKEIIFYAYKVGFILWVLGIVFLLLFGKDLLAIFSDDSKVIDAGIGYLYAAASSLYAYMLVFFNVSLLQGIKEPKGIIYLSIARQLIVPAIVFEIFRQLDLALWCYWFGLVAIIWLSAIFIIIYAKKQLEIKTNLNAL